jgi:uncharacterized protein (DUF3820 family)
MAKYRINNIDFNTKDEITKHCRVIINGSVDQILSEGDHEFIMAVLRYHPKFKKKVSGMSHLYVDKNMNNDSAIFIMKQNGRFDDISITKCISCVPFNQDKPMELVMPFGKYKDQSIYDIDDNSYFEWLYKQKWLDAGMKIKIGQFLRYGFIPYTPKSYGYFNKKK